MGAPANMKERGEWGLGTSIFVQTVFPNLFDFGEGGMSPKVGCIKGDHRGWALDQGAIHEVATPALH